MGNKIVDRCKIICGGVTESCVIDNARHLDCIADMVINNTSVISLLLGRSLQESPNEAAQNIHRAMTISNELSNWVKYLQITRNLKHLNAIHWDGGTSDRREVARYPLPRIYEKYISMKVTLPGRSVPVSIIDFCQRGTQFQSPESLQPGTVTECTLATTVNMKKEVHFRMMIKFCSLRDDGYRIGAHIADVGDSSEFNFFNNVYDFIVEIEKKGHHLNGYFF
jgi:hypothetical protein